MKEHMVSPKVMRPNTTIISHLVSRPDIPSDLELKISEKSMRNATPPVTISAIMIIISKEASS